MIDQLRNEYNRKFNENNYKNFIKELNSSVRFPTDFRVSETPVFLTGDLTERLTNACSNLLTQIKKEEFLKAGEGSIPKELFVPGETSHPQFLQFDFAFVKNPDNVIVPKLIELQGFPTVYAYQSLLNDMYRKYFSIPKNFTCFFNNITREEYHQRLTDIILGKSDPENVILMEIKPETQKTRIDFAVTEKITGIQTVCISNIIKKGNKLFYKKMGKEIPVERIYNRVIFDELIRDKTEFGFDMRDDLDVEWAGHPNWFFKISKYSLPFLKDETVPESFFLNTIETYPDDLENYVLKPLYSFAGLGVEIDLTEERLDKIEDKTNYILQRKIEYEPVIITPDGNSKVEIRMMYLWDDQPLLVNNLIRMSKGKMMGVDFNKNKTWVGSSIAYHSADTEA